MGYMKSTLGEYLYEALRPMPQPDCCDEHDRSEHTMNNNIPQSGQDARTIIVRVRGVYGRELIYPHCITAQRLAHLTGATTLTPHALRTIKDLGYRVEVYCDHATSLDKVAL